MTPANPAERLFWTAFTAWHTRGQSRLPYLPRHRLEAIQARRVRRIVAHAYANVPYYREAMDRLGLRPGEFRTAADLARLPLLSPDELARDPERFCARDARADRTLAILTSGTTGHRKQVLYDLRYVFLGLAAGQRRRDIVAKLSGIPRGARIQEFLTEGSAAALVVETQLRNSFVPRPLRGRRQTCSYELGWDEALALVNASRADILHGYGAFLGTLFRRATAAGVDVHRPRLIIAHSETMPDADRELIEERLGVPVISMYVAAESGFIACQCEERRGFHVDIDRVAMRAIDDAGRSLPPGGRGEIVVSNLTNRATVLLNYRLGDVVTLGSRPCPCGRTLPTIESIDGRTDSVVHLANGIELQSWDLVFELQQTPDAVQLQFRHEEPGRVVLRAVLRPDADASAFRARGLAALARVVGAGIAYDVEIVPAITPGPGGKVRGVERCFGPVLTR